MFFRNILFENNSPFEEHNNFTAKCSDGLLHFNIGVSELIRMSSNFPKSAIDNVILVWLIYIATAL